MIDHTDPQYFTVTVHGHNEIDRPTPTLNLNLQGRTGKLIAEPSRQYFHRCREPL